MHDRLALDVGKRVQYRCFKISSHRVKTMILELKIVTQKLIQQATYNGMQIERMNSFPIYIYCIHNARLLKALSTGLAYSDRRVAVVGLLNIFHVFTSPCDCA